MNDPTKTHQQDTVVEMLKLIFCRLAQCVCFCVSVCVCSIVVGLGINGARGKRRSAPACSHNICVTETGP